MQGFVALCCVLKSLKTCFHYGCAARCDRYRNTIGVSISVATRSAAVVEILFKGTARAVCLCKLCKCFSMFVYRVRALSPAKSI